jgi:hypothetical protein
MALRREFQAQRVVKHLKVVSKPGGFNVPTWPTEGVEQVKFIFYLSLIAFRVE